MLTFCYNYYIIGENCKMPMHSIVSEGCIQSVVDWLSDFHQKHTAMLRTAAAMWPLISSTEVQ